MTNKKRLTSNDMLTELNEFYTKLELENINTPKKIKKFFEGHIENNSSEIQISELFEDPEYHDKMVFVDTPDGMMQIGDYIKKNRECVELKLETGEVLECSTDHLIETSTGWKKAGILSEFDLILTKKGLIRFDSKKNIETQDVYDIEVLSTNHRYWTANGISSHNTAKTFVACYAALDLIKKGEQKRIILARPAVESGENLGFLPGSVDEKIAPYMEGYTSNMEKILKSKEKIKLMIDKKIIDMQPLAFMRSRTFDDSILILDEAQNADLRQIMLVVTRMGQNSKIVICGDITQWDIKSRKKDLLTFNEKIAKGVANCSSFEFTKEDIVRNPILIELTDKYEKYKEENNLDK